jgi:quercetin dioxygenase-like cupin family protein
MTRLIRTSGAVALFVLAVTQRTAADDPKNFAMVTPLMNKELAGLPNKEANLLTVEYLPGGASLPHRHDAHVFVYVLEGALLMQVDGQETVTLEAGKTFYENPDDVHRVSANASNTEPAKFLVFMIKERDKPVSRPVAPAP